jgi:hypothetical protein
VFGSEHVLVLLDCGTRMFDKQSNVSTNGDSPLDSVLHAAEGMVRSKVRATVTMHTGKRDAFGMLLYNTRYRLPVTGTQQDNTNTNTNKEEEEDEENNHYGTAGVYPSTVHEFLPFESPGKSTVQKIREAKHLQDDYANDDEDEQTTKNWLYALNQALEVFQKGQKSKKVKPEDSKQIWIFTNNDNPCRGQAEDFLRVVQTSVTDAQENGIDIVIWPLDRAVFDYSLFYTGIQASMPLRDDATEDTLEELLQDRMTGQWKKTRRAFAVPLLLPDWKDHPERPGIAMDVYSLIQVGKQPNKGE